MKNIILCYFYCILFCSVTIYGSQNNKMLTIHYHRYDNNYRGWSLWTWLDDVSIELTPEKHDDYGRIFLLNLQDYPQKGNINFLPKFRDWQNKDDPNRFWDRTLPGEIWILQGIAAVYISEPDTSPAIRKAFLDSPDKITMVLTHQVEKKRSGELNPVVQLSSGISIYAKRILSTSDSTIFEVLMNKAIKPDSLPAIVHCSGFKSGDLILRAILDQPEYITQEKLGVFKTDQRYRFSLFAPGAREVIVNIYQKPSGGAAEKYLLEKKPNGLWQKDINKD